MDNSALLASMSVAINRITEGFKLSVLSRYPNMTDEQRKGAMLVVSVIAGILVALVTPGSAEVFRGSFLSDYPLFSQVVLGLSLAFGSEVAFWLLKIMSAVSGVTAPKTTVLEAESLKVTEVAAPVDKSYNG